MSPPAGTPQGPFPVSIQPFPKRHPDSDLPPRSAFSGTSQERDHTREERVSWLRSFIPEPGHAAPSHAPAGAPSSASGASRSAPPGPLEPQGIGTQTRLEPCSVPHSQLGSSRLQSGGWPSLHAGPPTAVRTQNGGCRESGLTGQWDQRFLSGQVTWAAMCQPESFLRDRLSPPEARPAHCPVCEAHAPLGPAQRPRERLRSSTRHPSPSPEPPQVPSFTANA